MQDAKGQEGAEVLAHEDGVEANNWDARCAHAMPDGLKLTSGTLFQQQALAAI